MKARFPFESAAAAASIALVLGCTPETVTLERGKTEVVIAQDAPKSVVFAAEEMTNFLSRVFQSSVPLVRSFTEGRVPIVLGDNDWSRAVGLDPRRLPRDGFLVKVGDGRVFIAGVDDPQLDLREIVRKGLLSGRPGNVRDGERATLFGVYEFLQRAVGCRFYFPGELGEVVPVRSRIEVPVGLYERAPFLTVRDLYLEGDGIWPGTETLLERNQVKCLDWLRLRLQTETVPCCHGLNSFQLADRFGATRPEWFHLARNPQTGKLERVSGAGNKAYGANGHLCYSNDEMWDQVFRDAKAYFAGANAASVGIRPVWCSDARGWGPSPQGRFVDVMAQDGMEECLCDRCQAAYDKSLGLAGYASELIWSKTAAFAHRLEREKIPAIVTQMAYSPYSTVPKCDIPSNVWVMVKATGPWTVGNPELYAEEKAFVKAWYEKLGHKVWMWTYPAKHPDFELGIKGVPDYAPRAMFRAYKDYSEWSVGAFAESECENSLLHYMNYYVYSQLAWNPDLDIDRLLDEHYRLMYGAGAAKMKEAFELFEHKWIFQIAGKVVDTPLGPMPEAPSEPELWTKIWNEAELCRVRQMFDEAADCVSAESIEGRRIAFMRANFLDPLIAEGLAKAQSMDVKRALARRQAMPPRSLVANGSFDPALPGWESPTELCGYDTDTFVSPPASYRIENRDGKGWSVCSQVLSGRLKDNTRYRVSFFVRLDNVRRLQNTGHSCWAIVYYDKWHVLPCGGQTGSLLLGTADWFYYEGTFRTGVRAEDAKQEPYLAWGFNGDVIGTAWVDDIVLEEVGE